MLSGTKVNNYFKTIAVIAIGLTSLITTPQIVAQPQMNKIGEITDKKISEASGLAASRHQDNVFWVINDSGNKASVYAIDDTGKRIGRLKIKGVQNRDWEDLAAFEYDGKPYLLIADVGDNKAVRTKYTLYFIEEPNPKVFAKDKKISVKPKWRLDFTYEDGPRDSESVAVDIGNSKIILLSKRNQPPVFYQLPLQKKPNKQVAVAKRTGALSLPASPDDLGLFAMGSRPTAMDISQDGQSGVILTYLNAYYFHKSPPEKNIGLFATQPIRIPLPPLRQAESVCLGKEGQSLFVTSEKIPAPIYKIDLHTLTGK